MSGFPWRWTSLIFAAASVSSLSLLQALFFFFLALPLALFRYGVAEQPPRFAGCRAPAGEWPALLVPVLDCTVADWQHRYRACAPANTAPALCCQRRAGHSTSGRRLKFLKPALDAENWRSSDRPAEASQLSPRR